MDETPSIRHARDRADIDACVEVQRAVWGVSDPEATGAIWLIPTVRAGGLLLVAERSPGQIVAFSYAFPALHNGEPHLHSDMLGVLPAARGRGLGTRLRWAQREEALRRGISRLITWTFDPLQAGNAPWNLRHLGATATELLPDSYGATSSTLHYRLPTDLLTVMEEGRPRPRYVLYRFATASPSR